MKTRILLLAALLVVGGDALAWGGKPVLNIEDESVPSTLDGSPRSLEDVQAAIIGGCRRKGWNPVLDGDQQIKCSILVRGRHYAEVTIPYTESTYSILYSNSRELNYDAEKNRIHRNYNKWVTLLSGAIQQQFAL